MGSKAKHTPLPWRHGDAYHDPGRGEDIFIGSDGIVVATTGDIGGFIKGTDADLVLTSVNTRPKVEELVSRVLLGCRNSSVSTLQFMDEIIPLAREVEAALKGETGG